MGPSAVSKLAVVALSVLLLAPALAACSLAGPSSDIAFTPKPPKANPKAPPKARAAAQEDAAERMNAKMQADAAACRSVARQRGIRSLLAIAQSVNPRNTDQSYIACMKKKGYNIAGEADKPDEEVESTADQVPESPE